MDADKTRYENEAMKKHRNILCFALILAMILSFSAFAFADRPIPDNTGDVEEAVDEVALAEAEAAAQEKAEAEAKAKAERVTEVVDIDADEETAEEVPKETSVAELPDPAQQQGIPGSTLALFVGMVLIALGGLIIVISNRKIRKGRSKK